MNRTPSAPSAQRPPASGSRSRSLLRPKSPSVPWNAPGPLSVEAGIADGALAVRSVTGTEALGSSFEYAVELLSDDPNLALGGWLGKPMAIRLADGRNEPRYVHGLVASARFLETTPYATRYRAILRPWLWLLTKTKNCRIFQQRSIPDVVEQVFRDRGFADFERSLHESYPPRDYVVQYNESDFDFVSRLLEDCGIYYYFRHGARAHTLVLADSPFAHRSRLGCERLPHAPSDEHRAAAVQYVDRWEAAQNVSTGSVVLRDYDYAKPDVKLEARAKTDAATTRSLEIFEYPGSFATWDGAEARARLRSAQATEDAETVDGHTNARALVVGARFELDGHPRRDQNGAYVVRSTSLTLSGSNVQSGDANEAPVCSCDFVAAAAALSFRATRRTARPIIAGPQTAVVVGPAGQEIWTDELGRVKVQFHWDREGRRDETSSCWVRVAQGWAGANWGMQFLPRIGQEVVVSFLEGDPDRPLITGSVYNANAMPPYPLPQCQTQSGVRSRSSPDGLLVNGNEILFEDKKGSENLLIRAERTQTTVVKGDQTETVGASRTVAVETNDVRTVALNETATIGGAQTTTVGGNRVLSVTGNDSTSVSGNHSVVVKGAASLAFEGDFTHAVSGATQETSSGDVTRTYSGRVSSQTAGATQQSFSDDYTERHSGHRTVIIGSKAEPRTGVVHVEGRGRVYVSKSVELEVLEQFTLLCGDSQILISPNGITLSSPNITLAGSNIAANAKSLNASGSDILTLAGKAITATTAGGKLALDDATASLTGQKVKLGSGSGSSSSASTTPTKVTRAVMRDAAGKPRANARVLLDKDGEQRMTVLDADGALELIGDASYKVSFPDDRVVK